MTNAGYVLYIESNKHIKVSVYNSDDVPDPEREGLLPSGGRRYASTQSIEDTREYYSPFHTPEGKSSNILFF